MWPGSFGVWTACTAESAGGTTSGGGGIISGGPETVKIVIVSPLVSVDSGGSLASK